MLTVLNALLQTFLVFETHQRVKTMSVNNFEIEDDGIVKRLKNGDKNIYYLNKS